MGVIAWWKVAMKRIVCITTGGLLFWGLTGCVERRYVVTSDPPGAVVLRNNYHIGAAPADDHFDYYGNYHFTLIKDGYTTLQVDQNIEPPWYGYFPLDFVAEVLIPWKFEDVRRFHYKLEPMQAPNLQEVLNRGQSLRDRGKSIGAPAAPPANTAPAPIGNLP
jgi:hypothetical protein